MSTIFRNPDGTVAYPSIVPPAVEFPYDSVLHPPHSAPIVRPSEHTFESFPEVKEQGGHSTQGIKPSIHRSQTERPRPTTRESILPSLVRNVTNVSVLNEALRNQQLHDDSSSSSSSSEDEEEEPRLLSRIQSTNQGRHKDEPIDGRNPYSRFSVGNENFKTRGKISKRDGRLNISVNETRNRGYLAKALGAAFLQPHRDSTATAVDHDDKLHGKGQIPGRPIHAASGLSSESTTASNLRRPTLNLVIMVIGSRGDIQPFLKIGKVLKENYGHRVRIATHPVFRDFVQKDSGLEFFSVGGDPSELMAFMVKNPGMIPNLGTLRAGEIGRRRDQMSEMFEGFWRACINATDDEHDANNLKMMGEQQPFICDAIIANPPSFAHVHCAERLGVPLHLMFTMPWTPTRAFPHPLANIKKSNVDPAYTNFMSYPLVEMMTWQGLGDLVNSFRVKTLGLEPVSTLWAPGSLYRLKVPYTYIWSPSLVPKPKDWGPEVDIAGYVFLDLAKSFKPPEELVKFLKAGEPPIYIGFGSIVVDDPNSFTQMIYKAVELAGVRALVSKGWGGFGGDDSPENVYLLENTPHDWLFPQVKGVVHHGGAGTTAIGLKCGKPTMIVPFFGDQQFWGSMIGKAGAGAMPVPYKDLTVEKLADGIKKLLTPEAQKAAEEMAKSIEREGDGAENAVESFHRSLVLFGNHSMRCSIFEDRVAVWRLKGSHLRLSALAAEILVEKKRVALKNLQLIRHEEYNDFEGPGEPLSGGAGAIFGDIRSVATAIGKIPFTLAKRSTERQKHNDKKRRKSMKVEANLKRMTSTTASNGLPAREGNLYKSSSNHKTKGFTPGQKIAEKRRRSKEKAQATGMEKATSGNDSGKQTALEPVLSRAKTGENADGVETGNDAESVLSEDPEGAAEEVARDVGGGLGEAGLAIARELIEHLAPMDLSIAIAQGFHNAPRLYGDQTVRRPTRINGLKSGLKAAGREFAFGIYDGVTGLVKQPYYGARDGGILGFSKGIGMGLTGFVLKDLAAFIAPVGYTLKGIQKELHKSKQPTVFIRRARTIQGQRDFNGLSRDQRIKDEELVDHAWAVMEDIWKSIKEIKSRGLKGRLLVFRERKKWKAYGIFENIDMVEKALAAVKRGESVDELFKAHKEELRRAEEQTKDTIGSNLQQRAATESKAGNGKEGGITPSQTPVAAGV